MTFPVTAAIAVITALASLKISAWRTGRSLERDSRPLEDPGIEGLCSRLAALLRIPEIAVHVYEVDPINGLVTPDGKIYLTRGLVDQYRQGAVTGAEIASVVAHELGHVAMGHFKKRMVIFSGSRVLTVALGAFLSRFIPRGGFFVANMLSNLLIAGISRKDEYEADAFATALMVRSGIGSDAQKSLLRKLDSLSRGSHDTPAWLQSHPKTRDRIAAIERIEGKWSPD